MKSIYSFFIVLLATLFFAETSKAQDCNINFSYSISTSTPHTVRFTPESGSSTVASYIWTFGDGSASFVSPNPIHTYDDVGTY